MKIVPGIMLTIGTSLVLLISEKVTECAFVDVCLYVPFGTNAVEEIGLFNSEQCFDSNQFLILD